MERKPKFKVGDKVVCVKKYHEVLLGMKGIVTNISCNEPPIGVSWDKGNNDFHSCGDTCPDYHGYYVYPKNIELSLPKITNWKERIENGK